MKLKQHIMRYYQIVNKNQPVGMEAQSSHLRRFVSATDLNDRDGTDFVSPFIYFGRTNICRVTTTEEKHRSLEAFKGMLPITKMEPLLNYENWLQAFGDGVDPTTAKFEINILTPLAIHYQLERVHYRAYSSLYQILLEIRDQVRPLGVLGKFPARIFRNTPGYSLHNTQPEPGCAVSFGVSYTRAKKRVTGMAGYLNYDCSYLLRYDERASYIMAYFEYLQRFITAGYRKLSFFTPYKAGVAFEDLKEWDAVAIGMHPVNQYPMLFQYSA